MKGLRIKVTFENVSSVCQLRDLPSGRFAVGLPGTGFEDELFYANVAGFHGLSADRYWPSDYIERDQPVKTGRPDFLVRIIEQGESFTIEQLL